MPLAAAEVMGSVTEVRMLGAALEDADLFEMKLEDVMGPALQTIGTGQSIEIAVEALDTATALLVLDGGRPTAVISRSDLLRYLSETSDAALPDGPATVSYTHLTLPTTPYV